MNVNIYVSTRGSLPRYGFLAPDKPISLLPRGEDWKYVRSADTAQFNLPEVIQEEIDRRGFWSFGGRLSQSAERRASETGIASRHGGDSLTARQQVRRADALPPASGGRHSAK